MTEFSAANRKYRRWYFAADESQPKEIQTNGVAVKLARQGWFGAAHLVCHAVVKDISLGGAGVLVPATIQVPDAVFVMYQQIRIKAQVVYRQQVTDKLIFLGIDWENAPYEQRLKVLRKLSRKSSRPPRKGDKQL